MHNQHIVTYLHTNFQQASLNSFWVISGSICFGNILTISVTIATTILMGQWKKMTCIIYTLLPIHIPTFINLACIVFQLDWNLYNLAFFPISVTIATVIFMRRWKKNNVHNLHIATCSHTKFHQAGLFSSWVIAGSRFQQTDGRRDGWTDGRTDRRRANL